MRRTVRMITAAAILGVTAFATAPAEARRIGHSAPEPSVFPQSRDPWRSWGVRNEVPKHVGPPSHAPGTHFYRPPAGTVWVPGHWVWDGTAWVWWPGHWGVR